MLQIYLCDGSAEEPALEDGRDKFLPGGSEDLHQGRGLDNQDRGPGSQLGGKLPARRSRTK